MDRGYLILAVLLILTSGCTRPVVTSSPRRPESYISSPGSVGFDNKQTSRVDGSIWIQAAYSTQGKVAKFGIEFGPPQKPVNSGSRGLITGSGTGRFVAQSGSDATILLADLRRALEAKAVPSKIQRVKTVPFLFVRIGDNLSQAQGGGLNAEPPGEWSAIKVFIGQEQEGELFVNLNAVIGKGEFSIKDPEYGDILLKHLAGVL